MDSADTRESCLRGRNLGPSLKETERGCRVRDSLTVSSSEDKSPTLSRGATICSIRELKLYYMVVHLAKDYDLRMKL